MEHIRPAAKRDAGRIAEILVFNYRMNFYPIFRDDDFYFGEMTVESVTGEYLCGNALAHTIVYDDGAVKGFLHMDGSQIKRLFVEPILHGQGIGKRLLEYAVSKLGGNHLWALEKNRRAIAFYERSGFVLTGEKKPEDDTTEYLVRMERR